MNKIQSLIRIAIVLTLFLGLVNFANAQKSLDKEVLVNIGTEEVSVDEFMRVYSKNNTQTSMQGTTPIEEYLDLFINFKLKVMEAEELKMDTVSSFNKELTEYRKQLAKPYFVDESVNEALLKEAYEHKLKDIRASHILIMVDENARPEDTLAAYNKVVKIRQEVIGGLDFAEAAVTYSDDPSAQDREEIQGQQRAMKGNKGDLGYFTGFNMVYPFEEAAYNTPVGEVSQPVRTRFGYHLIKVVDKKDALGIAQVAHIYVTVPPNTSTEDSLAKLEKINNIYTKIEAGMPFETAVKEYSEDKGSAKNGGKLSKFSCNRVVPEFVLAAESLEIDEVSEPVQTMYGYHILKLISRETPGTFEEEAPALKEKLAKDSRSHKSEEAVIQQIKVENKLKIYDKAKVALFATIDTSIINKSFLSDSVKDFIKPIMKIGSEKYSQYDFAVYAEKNQKKQPNIDKDVYLEQLFTKFVDDKCLAYEDKHLEEKYPEFAALMKEYHDGILLFNLTDEKVWSKAVKDTIGLDKFFNENRTNYMWDERVDATIYKVRKKDDVSAVKEIISNNVEDGDIAKALDKDSITSVTILPGKYERGDNKDIDAIEWKPAELYETNSDVEDLHTFIRIKEVLAPQPKELNETRGMATADYQTYLEKEWIEQLKQKYPVVVDKEILKQVIATQ